MAEKSDEEIINEVGLESNTEITEEEALAKLSLEDYDKENLETKKEQEENDTESPNEQEELQANTKEVLENEDRDELEELSNNNDSKNNEKVDIQKKQPKIFKILIAVLAFLIVVLTIGIVLYLSGFFEKEPVKTPKKIVEKKVEPEIMFNKDDINEDKLNKKLTFLTKKEIMNKEELEAEEKRIQEEERKKKEAKQKALEEKKKKEEERLAKIEEQKKALKEEQDKLKAEQEELLNMQEKLKADFEEQKKKLFEELQNKEKNNQLTINNNNTQDIEPLIDENPNMNSEEYEESNIQEEVKETKETKENLNQFLSFINVATIKGELYKSYLDKLMNFDKKVSLCRDNKNRIEVYFGPYSSKKERQKVLKNLEKNGYNYSYLVDLTKEEYEKRCKY